MKKSNIETKGPRIVKLVDGGTTAASACRTIGVSPATYYNWLRKTSKEPTTVTKNDVTTHVKFTRTPTNKHSADTCTVVITNVKNLSTVLTQLR